MQIGRTVVVNPPLPTAMIRRASVLALVLWWAATPQGRAQEAARTHVERGLAAASTGDTAAALYELREAVRRDPKLADAHYHLARLHLARAGAVEGDFEDRIAAQRSIQKALSLEPSNPLYLLELGKLKLKQQIRVDALRLFNRALSEARAGGDLAILAEVHYHIGTIYEMWYESLAHKRLKPILRGPPAAEAWQHPETGVSEYVNNYLDEAPEVENSGWLERDIMIEHYRAALRHDPGHVETATRLLGHLYDEGRLTEYLALAEPMVRRAPERAEPHLFLGLGYHAMGREVEATEAFRRGLDLLPEADRQAIESLAPVLRRKDARTYEALDAESRLEFESRFWAITDPLYLTEANEHWIEHIARAAYADLRFGAPEMGLRGWETDRGVIYIRYGRPERIGHFSPELHSSGDPYRIGQRTIVWSYGRDAPTFVFQQRPGYRHAVFAGDYEQWAAEYRHLQPAAYRIPSLPVVLEIPVQVARFRGAAENEAVVEVHAAIPVDGLGRGLDLEKRELETGLFLLEPGGRMVERRIREIALEAGDRSEIPGRRSWRLILPPDSFYHLGVEARDPLSWRAATARDTFTARRFAAGALQISDILLADFLHPQVEQPSERAELEIRPNPRRVYEPGHPVYLYYEIYDLQPDSAGYAAFDVALGVKVTRLDRGGGFANLLGLLADAWGFSIVGDDRVEVRFAREVWIGDRDRTIGWYEIDLGEAPPGEYEVRIEVTDRQTRQTARQERAFKVVKPEKEGA